MRARDGADGLTLSHWAESSSTPVSPVHLSPPRSHRGTSHTSVSTYSAQFGRLRESCSTCNWPQKSNICHPQQYQIKILATFLPFYFIKNALHLLRHGAYEPTFVSHCWFISALNLRWQKLLICFFTMFYFPFWTQRNVSAFIYLKAEIWQHMLALIFPASLF